ncbi:MAG: M10 family metallopeptidase [Prochloraceae cyanobacterium]|nr:M10 family metallopeptidase [Prochloraceae cyanobacterium]
MAYGSGTNTSVNTATNNNNIDGLLSTRRWASNTVTYSFTSNFFNDYEDESGYPNSATHGNSFETLNATQRAVAREVMQKMFGGVSGLNMVELTGGNDRNATIRIAESNDPRTAYAYYPGGSFAAGDVWFNRTSYNNPVIGNYAYHTFMHEFGHALGLKHGHELGGVRNVAMNSNRDSMEFSVMTYRSYINAPTDYYRNEAFGYAQSLMMYDIKAIQEMHGANYNYNSTNTFYHFSTTTGEMFVNGVGQGTPGANRIFRTVWDGNGNDSYYFGNYNTNLNIDLSPGGWSDLDVGGNFQRANLGDGNYARGHVFNALQHNNDSRSLIENAYGGTGDDRISGNNANNFLWGSSGDDTLVGGSGDDTLVGGAGADVLNDGVGDDVFKYYRVSESTPISRDTVNLSRGFDIIDLSAIDSNLNVAGNQAFDFIGARAFNGLGNGQVRYDAVNNIIQAEIQGDRNIIVDLEIKSSVSFTSLTASDFIL